MSEGLNLTTALTGMLPMILLVSATLTAPVAWLLLVRYRRAVIRSMAAAGRVSATASSPGHAVPNLPVPPLAVRHIGTHDRIAQCPLSMRASRSAAALGLAYLCGGLAYAVTMALPWMIFTQAEGLAPARFLWLVACYAWPIVLALGIAWALHRGEKGLLAGCYLLAAALIGAYALARNPDLAPHHLALFWLIVNGAPTVLLLTFLHRRVRAIGPLVAVFMLAAITGSQLLLAFIGESEERMRAAVETGALWGLGGVESFFALIVVGFVAFAVLGWWLLRRLGEWYGRRLLSDQMLILDALWLLFAIVQSIEFVFEGWAWLFTGLVAFAAYKVVTLAAFRLLPTAAEGNPTLLLLRVFALGRRSERVFDALAKRWLRVGSITMIAGPDLVTSTVEPHEMLDYLGGGLLHQFVADERDLERRASALARGPDPDGRFRVNEFFCYADTWQSAMKRLARDADAIVMDLRSFAPDNQGCLFEIEQLLAGADLRRVLLLVDDSTDATFLQASVHSLWSRVGANAPSAKLGNPELRLLHLAGFGRRSLQTLLQTLMGNTAIGNGASVQTVPA